MFGNNIHSFTEDVSSEAFYFSMISCFPFRTQTLVQYILRAHFYNGDLNVTFE